MLHPSENYPRNLELMGDYTTKPLSIETWEAFARLVEKHNGVWGGCWCTWFHAERYDKEAAAAEGGKAMKQRLIREGRAHAALVFDGDLAIGWCQYGTVEELPRIYHRKEWEAGLVSSPDYRVTCFFVDRDYRRRGVAAVALRGVLDLVATAGGGVVEGYPEDTTGRKPKASLLYSATRSMFEEAGFVYERPKGKKHCVMRTTVMSSSQ